MAGRAGKLLRTPAVSERLGVAEETLRYWRWRGEGPPAFKINGSVVYDEDELERWIAEQRDKQPA